MLNSLHWLLSGFSRPILSLPIGPDSSCPPSGWQQREGAQGWLFRPSDNMLTCLKSDVCATRTSCFVCCAVFCKLILTVHVCVCAPSALWLLSRKVNAECYEFNGIKSCKRLEDFPPVVLQGSSLKTIIPRSQKKMRPGRKKLIFRSIKVFEVLSRHFQRLF